MRTPQLSLFLAPLLLLLGGCNTEGEGDPMSTATVVLTDAASDEVEMFEVDVKDIVLTRLNGSTVSVMPRTTRVDFSSLETVSELIVGLAIPAGTYIGMSMTLDFSNASVCIVGQTTPATVLDPMGGMITGDVDVQIQFTGLLRPAFAVNRNHLFVLDLDLNQSVSVNAGSNEVTFTPSVDAQIDPTNPKPVAMNGFMTAVDLINGEVTVEKRQIDGTPIGTYTIGVTGTTIYQIDGVTSLGAPGLAGLATLVGGTPRVFVQGTISATSPRLNAVAIETGLGTPGNGQDWVHGHIIARDNGAGSDATLTVLGFSLDEPSGTRRFNTVHTVSVSLAQTNVLRRLLGSSATTDDLNVGQRIMAFGSLTGTALDASASTGVVRMLRTSVWGTANGTPSSSTMNVNVSRIGLRTIGQFNFTVGGVSQATPASFDVDVTGLSTTGITTSSKVRSVGFLNPVGSTGDDFGAESVIDHTTTANLLFCQWFPASTTALTPVTLTPTTSEVGIDVSAALIKAVGDGFGTTTLTTSPTPKITPLLPIGIYRIVENGAVELHLDYSAFTNSLSNRVGPQSAVFRTSAFGTYDAMTQEFKALVASVILL